VTAVAPRTAAATAASTSLPWLIRRAATAFWFESPTALLGGLILGVSLSPLVILAAVSAPAALLAVATLPPSLALTGLAHWAAGTAAGERPRVRGLLRLDPVLALIMAGAFSAAGFAISVGSIWLPVGIVVAAILALVFPSALTYGAVRGRSGAMAIRGGAILVAYRPSWGLTMLALAVLCGFAVAASAGVLLLVVPALVLTIGCAVSARQLSEIDDAQGAV
jgi:hypothetical protein